MKSSEVLTAVAQRRGCQTPEDIAEFLDPSPPIRNTFDTTVADYPIARDRLARAIARREPITVFGDYDTDGVTSIAQIVRFLSIAGANVHWFVHHRVNDDGGMVYSALARCIAAHHPKLLIAVDCGSNSYEMISWLKKEGVDTIVLDHHSLTTTTPGALAHLNPKATAPGDPLSQVSASGLAFLFADKLADELGIRPQWERIRAGNLIMAGLGIVADMMPMLNINRALVKHSLTLANNPEELRRLPGLVALGEVAGAREISEQTYTFHWAPRLNACGRMDDATTAVQLLLSASREEATEHARSCEAANNERIATQREVTLEAIANAHEVVSAKPDTKVIVLTGYAWHPGVSGIVAAKLKDTFLRPAFVLTWADEGTGVDQGVWRGSGRGYPSFNLDLAVQKAVSLGIAQRGGGHPMSVGVRIHPSKLAEFRAFMDSECTASLSSFTPTYEVLGHAESFGDRSAEVWHRVITRLAPFGPGNPRPYVLARNSKLLRAPLPKRKEDHIFAVSGVFSVGAGASPLTVQFDWYDPQCAFKTWSPNCAYDIVAAIDRRPQYDRTSVSNYNWRVAGCRPVQPTAA